MAYIRRTDKLTPTDMWYNPYWYSSANLFYDPVYMLPNCTCYVWGRLLELGATNLNLCPYDAGTWYGYNDGYQRGQTPQLGAVACWSSPSSQGGGHVAIVESINGNEIVTSNSNLIRPEVCGDKSIKSNVWNLYDYWYERTLTPPYGFLDYTFQGFIYVPISGGAPPEPSGWITGNMYLSRSEMDNNAVKFYYTMSRLGCSYNAILGMLANMQHESTVNPGIWESLAPYNGGYGLVQWTPYTKYSNWAGTGWENNGQKECERIIYESEYGVTHTDPNANQWTSNWYAPYVNYPEIPPISLMDFLHETALSPKVLADYWLLYYEHPYEPNIPNRIAEHQSLVDYYNNLLGGGAPVPPTPPTPVGDWKSNLLMMINKRKFVRKRGLQWR